MYVTEDDVSRGGTARKSRHHYLEKSNQDLVLNQDQIPEKDSVTERSVKKPKKVKKDADTSHHKVSKTAKKEDKKSKNSSHHHGKTKEVDTSHHSKKKELNTSHHHGRSKSGDRNTSHHHGTDSSKERNRKHHHGKPRSKSGGSVGRSEPNQSILKNQSSHTYEFDFESEEEKSRKQRHSKKVKRSTSPPRQVVLKSKTVDVQNTPKKKVIYVEPEVENFTFSRREKNMQDDINALNERMASFESEVILLIRNLKIDMDNRAKLMDEKLKLQESRPSDGQNLKSELEYLKGLNEALEEERKKDMIRSKKYTDERTEEVFNDLQLQRTQDLKDVDKKLNQAKLEQTEQLIECTDNNKREMRELRYSTEKNTEDIEFLMNAVKNLRKRGDEVEIQDVKTVKKSDSQLSTTIKQKVDDKLEEQLKKLKIDLKKEIKKENEEYVDDCINHNNRNFVVPTIENHLDKEESTKVVKKTPRESVSALPSSVDDAQLEKKVDKIISKKLKPELQKLINTEIEPIVKRSVNEHTAAIVTDQINQQVPQICQRVMENDLQLASREIVEKEIEPICKHIMIEEYARSRRNIIEKEIEPTCREIIEDEVPLMCQALVNKEFNQIQRESLRHDVKPICREVIDQEITGIIHKAIKDEYGSSQKRALRADMGRLYVNMILGFNRPFYC